MPVEVEVTANVCSGTTCFSAHVPDALVSITQAGSSPVVLRTDDSGLVAFQPRSFGEIDISVRWGDLDASPSRVTFDGSPLSISMRLSEPIDPIILGDE
ncbi:MAG: hypothetical protein ABI632_02665 [Pseudolysinimonas sp.]